MSNFTQNVIDDAEALGMTPEQYMASLSESELQKGTYDFQIVGGKVTVNGYEGVMKDCIQANLNVYPVGPDGMPVKRYGMLFIRITLPVPNGQFVPNDASRAQGVKALRWLAEQVGTSVATLTGALKNKQFPSELLQKTVRGYFYHKVDKKDPNKSYPTILPAKATDKLTPIKAGGPSADAGLPTPAASDDSMPF